MPAVPPPALDILRSAEDAVIQALPPTIRHHRESGHLTWRLLHKIEDEVLADVASSGKHSPQILRLMRAPAILGYPKDDRPASF
ncbi:DUF2471 family protein [Cupriavidus sp. AcVe19-6a]|uniref:DUF2471 family protein n=1 Tax=Cupriavidus sp. AcVe19-6a TaxID=2821358 RepID=UPI00352D13F8